MKNKKIIFLFLFLVMGLNVLSWIIIQNNWAKKYLNLYVAQFVAPYGISLKITSITPTYGLGARLKGVTLEQKADASLKLYADSIEVDFNLLSIFSRKISIKQLTVNHAFLKLNFKDRDNNRQNNISQLFNQFQQFQAKLPVAIEAIKCSDFIVDLPQHKNHFPVISFKFYSNKVHVYGDFGQTKFTQNMDIDGGKVDFFLLKNSLLLKKISIYRGTNIIDISGEVKSLKEYNLQLLGHGELSNILHLMDVKEQRFAGHYEFKLHVKRSLSSPVELEGPIKITSFSSRWFRFKQLKVLVKVNKNIVSLHSFSAEDDINGQYNLLNKNIAIFNFKTKKKLVKKIDLALQKASLGNLFYFLNNSKQRTLRGKVSTSRITIHFDKQGVWVKDSSSITIDKFSLKHVLNFSYPVKITRYSLNIPYDTKKISFGGNVLVHNSSSSVQGILSRDFSTIKLLKFKSDLTEIKNIASVAVGGNVDGELIFELGRKNRLKMYLSGDKVSIFDFYLGHIQNALMIYSFDENSFKIAFKRGRLGRGIYSTVGKFFFNQREKLKSFLNVQIEKARIQDIKHALAHKVSSSFLNYGSFIHGSLAGNINYRTMKQGYDLAIKVRGKRILLGPDQFQDFRLILEKHGDIFNCKKLQFKKGTSSLNFTGLIDFKQKGFTYQLSGQPVTLRSFAFFPSFLEKSFRGMISIKSKGEGSFSDFTTSTILKLKHSYIGKKRVLDSILSVDTMGKEIFVSSKIGGEQVVSNLYLNFNPKKRKRALFSTNVNIKDMKQYYALFNPELMRRRDVSGKVKFQLNMDFLPNTLNDLNLSLRLDKFESKIGKDFISIVEPSSFNIVNGRAKKQKIEIIGNNSLLKVSAHGEFYKNFLLSADGKMDLTWLSIVLSKFVERISGRLEGKALWRLNNKFNNLAYQLWGEDISIVSFDQKLHFDKLKFRLEQDNQKTYLKYFMGTLNQGKISLTGTSTLSLTNPKVNIQYSIDKIRIAPLNNTIIFASSHGRLFGEHLPLALQGKIIIDSGEVKAELSDVMKKNKMSEYDKSFLPSIIRVKEKPLLDIQLKYQFLNPLHIQNSLVDMKLTGHGTIRGSYDNLLPDGKVVILPHVSKFLFKGNDFKIKKGEIFFGRKGNEENVSPSFNIIGDAQVGKYLITAELKGDATHPITELHSEPALTQNDILSILMIGFTSAEVTNIDEKERELATSVGIGALFADQLRLGKELNNMFGVKLSIMPELSDSTVDYASAISSTGNGTKTKTSTKIELKKKIRENVELSFSSTVGGSSEQIQKINVNYNIKPNLSLEGVYEIREEGDGNRISSPESVGVDLKMNLDFE